MAGEIASAYVALLPTLRGFGTAIVAQGGPQIAAAGRQLGVQGGTALGSALGGSAAKASIPAIGQVNAAIVAARSSNEGWLSSTAGMAVKNVALYGSMYAVITSVQQGAMAALTAMVGFNAQLEQSRIGFETLLGSSAAAEDQMSWIKQFAKETPFQYSDLVLYSQQLLALGFNAEQSRQVLAATGDAAAALGRGSESIARINLALGQMWTKGKVQSQEMLQLTEAGIGGWQILADAYGTSVGEVQDAVTKGLISAQEAVPALLAGMEAQFGGLMERQSSTFTGVVSNIQDTLQQQFAKAGEPLFGVLTVQAQEFLDALDDPEAVGMLTDLGQSVASGAEALAAGAKFAWEFRDAIVAVGVGFVALKVAQSAAGGVNAAGGAGGVMSGLLGGTVAEWRAASVAAKTAGADAVAAKTALATAQTSFTNASMQFANAGPAVSAANAEVKRSIYNYDQWSAATARLRAAQSEQFAAQQALTAAAPARVAAERASAAAADASAAAEARLALARRATLKAGALSALGQIGPVAGIGIAVAGIQALSDAQADAGQTALGMAGAIGGGALAGAAMGSIFPVVGTAIGAAAGATVGFAGSLWSMSAATDAANKDVTTITDSLVEMGVQTQLAKLATSGLTKEQLAAAGGFEGIANAMKSGTLGQFADELGKKAEALQTKLDGLKASSDSVVTSKGLYIPAETRASIAETESQLSALKTLMDLLGLSGGAWEQVQTRITESNYAAAYAADMQTGSLGLMTQAAWDAVMAQGGLSSEFIATQLRAEGLAGTAGFLTQMIAGIPKGTAINFKTNANDVAVQIVQLRAAAEAGFSNLGMTADGYERRVQQLQAQYAAALSTPSVSLSLPGGGSGGGGAGGGSSAIDAAAQEASRAAQEAARKLEQDRTAQLRFGDAFGSIMEAALGGNFEQYRTRLEDQITSLTRDGYGGAADALKRMSPALNQASLDYAALTSKLKAAATGYDDLTKKMRDQYTTSRDLVLGLGKATDAQSFDQLAYLLGQTTSQATEYQDVLSRLKNEGLSQELWDQLAQAGPESMALAQSILAQGQAGIDQLNSLSTGLMGAADSMGTLVSESMYKQGVDAMNAYIEGLKSGSTALENQLALIGNNILGTVAGTITPGNAGYKAISAAPQQVVNQITAVLDMSKIPNLNDVQQLIDAINNAATTKLVNEAGTVTS